MVFIDDTPHYGETIFTEKGDFLRDINGTILESPHRIVGTIILNKPPFLLNLFVGQKVYIYGAKPMEKTSNKIKNQHVIELSKLNVSILSPFDGRFENNCFFSSEPFALRYSYIFWCIVTRVFGEQIILEVLPYLQPSPEPSPELLSYENTMYLADLKCRFKRKNEYIILYHKNILLPSILQQEVQYIQSNITDTILPCIPIRITPTSVMLEIRCMFTSL